MNEWDPPDRGAGDSIGGRGEGSTQDFEAPATVRFSSTSEIRQTTIGGPELAEKKQDGGFEAANGASGP